MRNVLNKTCRENKNKQFFFSNYFSEDRACCGITLKTQVHCYVSTATMITRWLRYTYISCLVMELKSGVLCSQELTVRSGTLDRISRTSSTFTYKYHICARSLN
jgi:hypothetical protein